MHFLGRTHQVIPLAEHVRNVLHLPVWGTERLPFLGHVSGQTDLAAYNRKRLPYLQACDVIHATHPLFAFGRTAMRYAQHSHTPLVSSIHTDTDPPGAASLRAGGAWRRRASPCAMVSPTLRHS